VRLEILLNVCVCWVDLFVNVNDLHFMREYPDYWEPKNSHSPLKLQGGSCEGGLWFFVKLVKQSLGS
jgi:hypothetical protein